MEHIDEKFNTKTQFRIGQNAIPAVNFVINFANNVVLGWKVAPSPGGQYGVDNGQWGGAIAPSRKVGRYRNSIVGCQLLAIKAFKYEF